MFILTLDSHDPKLLQVCLSELSNLTNLDKPMLGDLEYTGIQFETALMEDEWMPMMDWMHMDEEEKHLKLIPLHRHMEFDAISKNTGHDVCLLINRILSGEVNWKDMPVADRETMVRGMVRGCIDSVVNE